MAEPSSTILPPRAQDLTGKRFGKLVVLSYAGKNKRNNAWLCQCDCGNQHTVIAHNLTTRHSATKSCGCLPIGRHSSLVKKPYVRKARKPNDREHRCWHGIISRCYNPEDNAYHLYGARGISVCDRWRFGDGDKTGFACFFEDVGWRPTKKHSLDRRDNDGNYEPNNCRWATQEEQMNNTRRNVNVTIGNRTMTIAQWSRASGISHQVIRSRIRSGWEEGKLLTPIGSFRNTKENK